MGLLKFLFIAVLVYYSFRFLMRVLLPFLLKYLIKKTGSNIFGSDMAGENPGRAEGDVSIDYSPNSTEKKKTSDDEGEYIDFEELDK